MKTKDSKQDSQHRLRSSMPGGVHVVVLSGCIRVCDYSWHQ